MENGKLRVWWIPQVPGEPFYIDVYSPQEAKKVIKMLGKYDAFQFENNIKPDYSNAGGLEVYDKEFADDPELNGWTEWYDEDTGDSIDEWEPK